ncbi:prepilin peptidase [Paenibacillus turpanensis]|uniref:prepilin peptidase n=1 Tax=Paenibacillus turpanensis TaxID=2689078 RepID=UPI001409693D|nr:A24 family peptidase [Paenibacillus turpanensis]
MNLEISLLLFVSWFALMGSGAGFFVSKAADQLCIKGYGHRGEPNRPYADTMIGRLSGSINDNKRVLVVGALHGLLYGAAAFLFGPVPELLAALLLVSVLLFVTQTDITIHIIPDKMIAYGSMVIFMVRLWIHPLPWWDYFAASLLGFLLMYTFAWISRGGVGGGDIKLYLFLGLVLGIEAMLWSLFLAVFLGGIASGLLLLTRKFSRHYMLPFGPFIAAGSLLSYFYFGAIRVTSIDSFWL